MISYCGFGLHPLMASDLQLPLMSLLPLFTLFGDMSVRLQIVSPILWVVFLLSQLCTEVLVLTKSSLSSFSFVANAFVVIPQNPLPNPRSWACTPMFSSNSFIFLALKCRFMIHF